MRKSLLFLLAGCLAVSNVTAQEYKTPGNKVSLTFTSLSETPGSGVTKLGDTFYVSNDITVSETDTLTIENEAVLTLSPKVQILIEGVGNFAPADTAVIMSADDTAGAKGLRFSGDNASGTVKNIGFETTALLSYASNGITVENCTFNRANGEMNSTGAVSFGPSVNNVIRNCRFLEGTVPAIGTGANIAAGILIENCYFYDNNTINANKPQLNITTPGANGPTIIRNNEIIGNQRDKVGGVAISNMLGLEMGEVIFENNLIQDHRYGMQAMGGMYITIKDNMFIDNRYDTNPMTGGSALSITDSTGALFAMVTGNLFQGSIWGITAIGSGANGFGEVNLGNIDPVDSADYNPGGNVFIDNGNNGSVYDPTVPYDLYNNSTKTIYAQCNTWSVAEQTAEEIEKVIFHKNDNPLLGEVIFMPAGPASVSGVVNDMSVYYDSVTRNIVSPGTANITIYDGSGRMVVKAKAVETVNLASLPKGVYVVDVEKDSKVNRLKVLR